MKDYRPIIESAKKEQSARGQCKWIIAMLEILTINHLPHLEKSMKDIKKGNGRIMMFLVLVLLVVLITNPQVILLLRKMLALVF